VAIYSSEPRSARLSCGTVARRAESTIRTIVGGMLDVMFPAASAVIDRKFAPKWDTYIDTFFSQSNGGLNNGFFTRPVLPLLKVEPLSVAVRRDGPR
jgi:hypothetical protein